MANDHKMKKRTKQSILYGTFSISSKGLFSNIQFDHFIFIAASDLQEVHTVR